ncbi:hypothetical protein [Parageobacillus thermoglucosidasius]|nr:hypothetical protein [Parageobacillus thermoglucosidasius]
MKRCMLPLVPMTRLLRFAAKLVCGIKPASASHGNMLPHCQIAK